MAAKPIPEGQHTITPYLAISGAAEALEFYKQAFGAEESFQLAMPDGRLGHAIGRAAGGAGGHLCDIRARAARRGISIGKCPRRSGGTLHHAVSDTCFKFGVVILEDAHRLIQICSIVIVKAEDAARLSIPCGAVGQR